MVKQRDSLIIIEISQGKYGFPLTTGGNDSKDEIYQIPSSNLFLIFRRLLTGPWGGRLYRDADLV